VYVFIPVINYTVQMKVHQLYTTVHIPDFATVAVTAFRRLH